jgi:hypothetical protein
MGQMELRRASDEEIVAAMKAHALPPLSGKKDTDDVNSYDYLLRLRMDRVKAAGCCRGRSSFRRHRPQWRLWRLRAHPRCGSWTLPTLRRCGSRCERSVSLATGEWWSRSAEEAED